MIIAEQQREDDRAEAAATSPTASPVKYCCSVKSTFTAPKWAVYSATS